MTWPWVITPKNQGVTVRRLGIRAKSHIIPSRHEISPGLNEYDFRKCGINRSKEMVQRAKGKKRKTARR
ncbi:hypothetical protein I7I50_12240 [Histoplasma capsulatum G186AR]|uniref:Uncharacterized protein n=1 Tax=Ajellomyces capsulatus TaxID=5037 RepID=A0A8H7YDY4_AJECA|nr:hypothetical protein I7I52_11448 [Histoplasma capsulatum]QSS70563.1 hypothetical protein I7I50_12240 [Histoplasma capsulatum G186AR]